MMLKGIRDKLRGYIPFTNWWLVWRKLDKGSKSILDLGCGKGKPMKFVNRHKRFYTVGIDGFNPYVEQCRREKSHDVVLQGDIRRLSYKDKTFDVVLCLQTLEHLDREDGVSLLRWMEQVARKQVIITTDINEFVQGAGSDGNELQEHKYIWGADEFREQGFVVYGIGIKGWGGENGYSRLFPQPLRWLVGTSLQILMGPIMWFKPEWAGGVLGVKNLSKAARIDEKNI